MKLPWLTELVLACLEPMLQVVWLWPVFLLGLMALDFTVLYRLGRPTSYRVLRELWAGTMLALPLGAACVWALALTLPYAKLMEGLTRFSTTRDQARIQDLSNLEGAWRLAGQESQGQAVPRDRLPADVLTFLPGGRFAWLRGGAETHGAFSLTMVRPKGIYFMVLDGPDAGQPVIGIYRLEGDKLTLCVAPPGTVGDDLPAEFATRDNKCTLYVFERAKP